jgi:hypothetical protein
MLTNEESRFVQISNLHNISHSLSFGFDPISYHYGMLAKQHSICGILPDGILDGGALPISEAVAFIWIGAIPGLPGGA